MFPMDIQSVLSLAKAFVGLIVVFGALLAYGAGRGNRALVSLILGIYIGLLVSLKFPYYDAVYRLATAGEHGAPIVAVVLFALFAALGTLLFSRLLPRDYEDTYEGVPKKLLLAALATVLIMALSYHALPVTALINPGPAVGALFGPPEYFFWLLIAPLVGLFFI